MRHLLAILIVLLALPVVAGEPLTEDAAAESRLETWRRFTANVVHDRVAGICLPGDDGPGVVVWPDVYSPRGTCDSARECKDRLDALCSAAGHGKSKKSDITDIPGGGKMCSGECEGGGAWAFVECKPQLLIRQDRRGRAR